MEDGLKKRLVGATILVSLMVIFVPMLLENRPPDTGPVALKIPPRPDDSYSSRVVPLDQGAFSPPPVQNPSRTDASQQVKTEPQIPVMKPAEPKSKPMAKAKPVKPTETKPVAKPAQPKQQAALSGWVIQAGSFSNRGNADALVKKLQAKKHPAFLEQATVNGKRVYRVMVGPEIDKGLAGKLLARVNRDLKSLKLTGKLKSYP
ncbi:MAG: hypothetical protein GY696_08590 [Gammaproteobacteria bacterium]|nr:hypothetical protein [Gammaproteobacteria bacterium]